jgi:hypothetical protein
MTVWSHCRSATSEQAAFSTDSAQRSGSVHTAQGRRWVGALEVWKTAAESRNAIGQVQNVTSARGAWPVLTESRDSRPATSEVRGCAQLLERLSLYKTNVSSFISFELCGRKAGYNQNRLKQEIYA